jgi:hypothetical protein
MKFLELYNLICEDSKTWYHGNHNPNLKSGKDLPDGHRGYFFTEDKDVAKKFGHVYIAELNVKNTFDGMHNEQQVIELFNLYSKYINVKNKEGIMNLIRSGNFAFYEDSANINIFKYDLKYDSNYQIEDGKLVLRVFDKKNIIKLTRIED